MQTTQFKKISERYTKQLGSKSEAIKKIMDVLGCSHSKAKQLRRGTYPHELGLLEAKALAVLFGCKDIDLMIEPSRKGSSTKSAS